MCVSCLVVKSPQAAVTTKTHCAKWFVDALMACGRGVIQKVVHFILVRSATRHTTGIYPHGFLRAIVSGFFVSLNQ